MNKDEKSLLDELWQAIGMDEKKESSSSNKPADKEPLSTEEADLPEASVQEEQVEPPKEAPIQEPQPIAEPAKPEIVKEKKKNIKFLVLYTVIFVIVISGLVGGSYLVSTRIHQEMGQEGETNESTLKNIQVQNAELKQKNAELEAKNGLLTQQTKDAEALLESVGDMVEHDQYLAAAQNALIKNQEASAKSIFLSIDREKLSEPNKSYYDTLKEKLGL